MRLRIEAQGPRGFLAVERAQDHVDLVVRCRAQIDDARGARGIVVGDPVVAVQGDAVHIDRADAVAARGIDAGWHDLAAVILAVPKGDQAIQTDGEILLRRLPGHRAEELSFLVVDAEAERAFHRRRQESDAHAGTLGRRSLLGLRAKERGRKEEGGDQQREQGGG